MKPANDNAACRSCGSNRLAWEPDRGWLTHGQRYLRCQMCGDCSATHTPAWVWVRLAILLAILAFVVARVFGVV